MAPPAKKSRKKASTSKAAMERHQGMVGALGVPRGVDRDLQDQLSRLIGEITLALELIAHQGWFNILQEPVPASLKQVHEFYRYFKAIVPLLPNKPSVQSQFLWDGEEQFLHTRDLARVIGIEPPPSRFFEDSPEAQLG